MAHREWFATFGKSPLSTLDDKWDVGKSFLFIFSIHLQNNYTCICRIEKQDSYDLSSLSDRRPIGNVS